MAIGVALGASPSPGSTSSADMEAQARTLQRRGVLVTSGGIVALGGSVGMMLVGRGPSGEVSNESQALSDFRSVSGAILLVGGFTTALIGADQLTQARAMRERARQQPAVTVWLAPAVTPGAASLSLVGRFP